MATSSLASLVVSLEANIAKFSTDMKSAADVTQRTMSGIQDSIGKAKSQFLSLAASVVSVGAAVQQIRGAIALGDELKQMSDQTGVAIDKLDRLSVIAKLNGADLDTMAKGFVKLGGAIIESQDATSKQAQLFQALGVSVKDSAGNLRGVEDVMGDVARALNGIENETVRAQVGTALLGKGYQALAATLRNYDADQKAANELLERFGGVSQTAANLADELGDRFTLLGEGSKRALLGGLVPGMAAVSQGIQELINSGGSLQSGFGDVVSKVAEFVTGSLISLKGTFQVVGTTIAAVMASIATGSLEPLRDLPAEIRKIEAEVNASRARIATAAKFPGLDDSDQISRAAAAQGRLNSAQADGAKLAKILGDATKATKAAIADYADEMDRLRAEMAKLTGTDGGYARLSAAELKIANDRRAGKIINEQQVQDFLALARAADDLEKEVKRLAEAWDAYEKAARASIEFQQELEDAMFRANQAIKAQNDALELEHATLGLTDNQRRQFIATLDLEKAQLEGNTNAVILLTKQLDLLRQQAADEGLLQMAEQARIAFENATAFASDFFVDLFNNGSKAFKNLWENFKQMAFRALAEVAARQVVVALTGAVGAGASGAAGASGLGALSSLGSAASGLSGLFGASSFTAGLAGDAFLPGLLAGGGSLTAASFGSALAPLMAAAPYAAIAAIAIPAIFKLFKGDGVANRTATFASGAASLVPDPSRDEVFQGSSAFGTFGIARDFWLGAEEGPAFRPVIDAITSIDNAIAAIVGGDLSQQIADALAQHQITVGFGKEGTDINASGGPAAILKDRYVTALGAIDETLGRMVQEFEGTGQELAQFVVTLVALHKTLGETFDGLDTASLVALGDAFGGLDKLAAQLNFLGANFTDEAEQAVAAQTRLAESFGRLGLTVPATHQAFLDLLSSFDLTTDSGRELYAAVLNLSGAFVEVNGTATQAAESMRAAWAGLEQARAAFNDTPQSTVQQNQLNALVAQFAGSREWAQRTVDASGVSGLVQVLSTIVQSDFAAYTPADQRLITDILTTAASLRQQQQSTPVGGGGFGGSVSIADNTEARVRELLTLFTSIAEQSTGDYGERLALQIKLVTGAISQAARSGEGGVAASLRTTNRDFAAALALFNTLSTRYTDEIAEQLVRLSETYSQQARQLQGNASGLDALNTVFEQQWNAIINGTAAGVDGTIDQLTRLRQGILGYVDSLKLSADSPLTASQKINEARSQYEATLARARTGDQEALGSITRIADTYIKLKRDFDASSPAFTEFFNQITGELTALGGAGVAVTEPLPLNAADQALIDALPTGAKLISALDLQDVASFLAETVRSGTGSAVAAASSGLPIIDNVRRAASGVLTNNPEEYDDGIGGRSQHPGPLVGFTSAGVPVYGISGQPGYNPATGKVDFSRAFSGSARGGGDAVASTIVDALMALAQSNSEDTNKLSSDLDRVKDAFVEAVTVGRK